MTIPPRSGKAENVFNHLNARLDLLESEESTLRRYVNTTTRMYNKALASLLKDAGRRVRVLRQELATSVAEQKAEVDNKLDRREEETRKQISDFQETVASYGDTMTLRQKEQESEMVAMRLELVMMRERVWSMELIAGALVASVLFVFFVLWRVVYSRQSEEERESKVTPPVSPTEKKNPAEKQGSTTSSTSGGNVVKIPKRPRAKSRGRRQ